MKTIKFLTVLLLFIGLFTFTSCDEDDTTPPENTHDDAYGDVILKKVNTPNGIRYKEVFFAGGIDINATGCTVTTPDGTSYDLAEFWAGPGKVNSMAGVMTAVIPAAGDYTFTLSFSDGYEKTITDTLEDTEIDLPMPFTVEYTSGGDTITLSWEAVDNADLYCVKVTELDMAGTKPLFKLAQLPTTETSVTINIDGGTGWMRPTTDLVTGVNYWVAVAAKKVEAGAEVDGASADFQTSSTLQTQITY